MKRSRKGNAISAQIRLWHEDNDTIHLIIEGVPNGHAAVNADPTKPNGHPTLFARLDSLLRAPMPEPPEINIAFVEAGGRVVKTMKRGDKKSN